jgi:hypothetical protein
MSSLLEKWILSHLVLMLGKGGKPAAFSKTAHHTMETCDCPAASATKSVSLDVVKHLPVVCSCSQRPPQPIVPTQSQEQEVSDGPTELVERAIF